MSLTNRLLLAIALLSPLWAQAGSLTIAAAADLKFAMNEILAAYQQAHPQDQIQVIYGSSGKFHTQIEQGAPYDLYFSADIALPQELAASGHAASPVQPYAVGRIVLWSASLDASRLTLESLQDPTITRVAIANPKHAPYGKRAEEVLRAAGVWDAVEPKLVFGENIAHTAQFVQTGQASRHLQPRCGRAYQLTQPPATVQQQTRRGLAPGHLCHSNPLRGTSDATGDSAIRPDLSCLRIRPAGDHARGRLLVFL